MKGPKMQKPAAKSYIDMETGAASSVPPAESGGIAGFISWRRLVELMARTGETRSFEKITRMVADERGLEYYIEVQK
jgi:hypothetical protein